MRHIIILTISLFFVSPVFSQDAEKIVFSKEFIGSGAISTELKIRMSLNLIDRLKYSSDGCFIESSQQIVGTYYYEKNGGAINLFGEITDWNLDQGETEKATFSLFEFNDKFEKVAEFKGVFTDTTFSGAWIHLSTKRSLPFKIRFDTEFNQGLKIKWENNTYIINEVGRNSSQNKFTCLDKFVSKKNLILIFRVTRPYCGLYNCRGMNCGGSEDYLHLYVISKDKQLAYFKKLTVTVDEEIGTISINKNKNIRYVKIDEIPKYSIDYQNPTKGIVEMK